MAYAAMETGCLPLLAASCAAVALMVVASMGLGSTWGRDPVFHHLEHKWMAEDQEIARRGLIPPRNATESAEPVSGKCVKLFNFGIHKTGTTTFNGFFRRMGFRARHLDWIPKDANILDVMTDLAAFSAHNGAVTDDNILMSAILRNQVFSDSPFNALFREITALYKDSACYVMTTREEAPWLASLRRQLGNWAVDASPSSFPEDSNFRTLATFRRFFYGATGFDAGAALRARHAHERALRQHFAAAGLDLVEVPLEWSDADKCSALCDAAGLEAAACDCGLMVHENVTGARN
ncbi:unnamed protein product [Pedinophyceae sp. YPF-701]|nr:unnamed protein product [Pedinophyceae sp. YPF-701]